MCDDFVPLTSLYLHPFIVQLNEGWAEYILLVLVLELYSDDCEMYNVKSTTERSKAGGPARTTGVIFPRK